MKTKEEILIKKFGKKYYDNNAITTNEALNSMQEYADQESEREAMEFAEWMNTKARWDEKLQNKKYSELYQIFKQQKEQK